MDESLRIEEQAAEVHSLCSQRDAECVPRLGGGGSAEALEGVRVATGASAGERAARRQAADAGGPARRLGIIRARDDGNPD